MGQFIVKLEDQGNSYYLVWSTEVDAPITHGMSLDAFKKFYQDEYGREGMRDLDRRMVRVENKGTSSLEDETANETIWLNRAGPNEDPLHREEIIEFYCRRPSIPKRGYGVYRPLEKSVAAFRKGLERCGPDCVAIERDRCSSFCPKCWGTDFVRPQ